MDRLMEIKDYLKSFQSDCMEKKVNVCKRQQEPTLLKYAEQVLWDVKDAQIHGNQSRLCYISLFHLRSSLWTGSNYHLIYVSDNTLYLNPPLATAKWVPEYLYGDEDEMRCLLQTELRKRFVRLNSFELNFAYRVIIEDYQKLTEIYWKQAAEILAQSDMFLVLQKEENWKFLSGTYMGDLNIVLQSENRR